MMTIGPMCVMLVLTANFFAWPSCGEDYVWKPDSLYRGTHPTSPNPWSTEWASDDEGDEPRSIQITIEKGEGYYNYIVIPRSYLPEDETDFTVVLSFRVVEPTVLPKTFYMFARHNSSQAFDRWQRFVGEPGEPRTIRFPLQLPPIEGGEWTLYMGCQGSGSIIVDRLVVEEGRDLVVEKPTPADAVTPAPPKTDIPEATGYRSDKIDLPNSATGRGGKVVSVEGRLVADGRQPVSEEVAQNNAKEMQRIFNELKSTPGPKTLNIPRGVYRFAGRAGMILDGVEDLTIDGQGSEFIFQKLYQGECFMISGSNRVVVRDLTLDWNWSYMPIASIGTVTEVSEDGTSAEFEFRDLDPQATQLTADSPWMGFYPIDPDTLFRSRRVEPGKLNIHGKPTLSVDGNRIKATFDHPPGLEKGISYSIRHLYYNLIGFKIASTSHLTFHNVTIHSLPGMGWLATGDTHHLHFNRCRIDRRNGSRYPLTTAADGIHANETVGNLVIENCKFTGLGDDAINLHDNAWQGGLEPGDNPSQLRFHNLPKHRLRISEGDVLRFFNPDYSPAGVELTVASEPQYDGTPNAYAQTTTTTVAFTSPVPEGLSSLSIAINTRFGTRNVLIANNEFVETFGRGILFAGDDTTIEGNTFREVFGNPIQIQADIVDNHWAEGSGSSNLVIRDNLFEDVNLAGRWEGAIVYVGGRLPWGPTEYPLFQKFLIEGNRFVNPPGPAFSFNSSKGFIVRDNMLELSDPFPNVTPYAGSVLLTHCSDVGVFANQWTRPTDAEPELGVYYSRKTSTGVDVQANTVQSRNPQR